MKNLKKRWGVFFSIIADPWTLVLIASVVLLFIFSGGQTNTTIRPLLFVLITISSAILGGRITKHWVDITEEGIVIARGKSAVRSLKLLLRNIFALEKRVAKFEDSTDEIKNHPEVVKRNYEEIQEICNLLEEETVNSIENWTDIIPEVDIKTKIGVISELKQSLKVKEDELTKLNNTKGKSDKDRKKLKAEVKEKKKQITSLERKIMERTIDLGSIIGANTAFVTPAYTKLHPKTGLLNIDTEINAHLLNHDDDAITIANDINNDLSKHIKDYKSKE
jgi:DNA repair exonuclease SbcCD ATPase subunit